MRIEAISSLFLSATLAGQAAAHAPQTSGNPPNVLYKATIKDVFFRDAVLPGQLKGSVSAQAPSNGIGVKFHVHFESFPTDGGPFTYHIHRRAVPEDGNCTATLSHLDPYGAGTETPCDPASPAACEVGDLSGKHGSVHASPFHASYRDAYIATKEGDEAFLGNLSVVLHYQNKTRLACANFVKQEAPYPTGAPNVTTLWPTATGVPTPMPWATPPGPPTADTARVHAASDLWLVLGAALVAIAL